MTDLARLIEKLEAASEGSEELDLAIARETATVREYYLHIPKFSQSLDAALSLVPEGWDWSISTSTMGPKVDACFFGNVRENQPLDPVTLTWPDKRDAEGHCHHRGGAPLALCIASLKARAALAEEK